MSDFITSHRVSPNQTIKHSLDNINCLVERKKNLINLYVKLKTNYSSKTRSTKSTVSLKFYGHDECNDKKCLLCLI